MRPSLLDPFFISVRRLSGIGPKVCGLLCKLLNIDPTKDEPRIIDLLQLMPHSVIDRRHRPGVAFARDGAINTVEIVIDQHQPPPATQRHLPYRIIAHDDTGEITLVFFHAQRSWLENNFPKA